MTLCLANVAVAVLFLLEIDNQLYEFAMPEDLREEVEANGRLLLDDDMKRLISVSKLYHFGAVVLLTNAAVINYWNITHGEHILQILASTVYAVGFFVERMAREWPSPSALSMGKGMLEVAFTIFISQFLLLPLALVFRYDFHNLNHN
eukprot:SAG31_NODE_3919_length_3751_cov_4.492607_3_plen_148_part_00